MGSLDLLVKAYGYILALLTSKPLAALTTLTTLGQSVGTIRYWPRRRRDPLDGISARQLLNVIKELGGDPAELMRGETATLQINLEPAPEERLLAQDERPAEIPMPPELAETVSASGEIITKGRRITYIREYPDGSREVIYVDG